jgi:phosphatidylglycerol lysyltransferase
VTEVFATLAEISVAWLARHRGGEKGFSVAAFKCDYVLSQPVALLREHGRPVAFATLMTTSLAEEATVGLMRHVPEASRYAMEFLFLKLILHFKEQSYGSFSLGVAPLSGLRTHRLAPRWHRLGRLIWAYGRRFYNFQGLRTFKNKFHPEWQPRYLAAPGSLGPYLALVDIAALTTARSDGREE